MTAELGAPATPDAARTVFGERLPVVEAYAELLATTGVERGLLGPRESPRLWDRHLLNCAGLADLIPDGARIADLGSGAGLPGLVLAALRPDLRVILLEPLLRRSTFLVEAVVALGLENVEVRRARAEDLAGQLIVDLVVARAVAALDVLVGWAMPLLGPGGRLLALKGERATDELAAARPDLAILGAKLGTSDGIETPHVVEVGRQDLATWARVVVVERGDGPAGPPSPGRAPTQARRPGSASRPAAGKDRPGQSRSGANRSAGSARTASSAQTAGSPGTGSRPIPSGTSKPRKAASPAPSGRPGRDTDAAGGQRRAPSARRPETAPAATQPAPAIPAVPQPSRRQQARANRPPTAPRTPETPDQRTT